MHRDRTSSAPAATHSDGLHRDGPHDESEPPSHRRVRDVSDEVGSEGGAPGDVELDRRPVPGSGSEATELWHPEQSRTDEIRRDDDGEGRRDPPAE